MKIAPIYLWLHHPFINIADLRSFSSEWRAERWFERHGMLCTAFICRSLSDVKELAKKTNATHISYTK